MQLVRKQLLDYTAMVCILVFGDWVQACQADVNIWMQIEQKHCAFVTFTSRQAAETAAEALSNRLIIKGNRCRLLWGKPQQKRDEAAAAAASMLPLQVCIAQHPQGCSNSA